MNPFLAVKLSKAFVQLVRDPNQLDVVFNLIDSVLETPAGRAAFAANLAKAPVAEAARQRVRIPRLDVEELALLPPGSFGEVAARFFRAHGLEPSSIPRRAGQSDNEWLNAYLFETHDLWHVLTGFSPSLEDELGLQAFYVAQVEGAVPLSIITAGFFNTLIFNQSEVRKRLDAISRGFRMGTDADLIVGVDWGALMDRPLADVRAMHGIHVDARHDAMARLPPAPPRPWPSAMA